MLKNFQNDFEKDVVVEEDDDDLPPIGGASTLTGSGSNNNYMQFGSKAPAQSVLIPQRAYGGGQSQENKSGSNIDFDM